MSISGTSVPRFSQPLSRLDFIRLHATSGGGTVFAAVHSLKMFVASAAFRRDAASGTLVGRLEPRDRQQAPPEPVTRGPVQDAAFVLSQALGVDPSAVTNDRATYNAISSAVSAAGQGGPIVIEGETGTGKDLLARMVHAAARQGGRLFFVNCSAGDRAVQAAIGMLVRATRSRSWPPITVFADNLDELSAPMQRRLLVAVRVLGAREQDGEPGSGIAGGVRLLGSATRPLRKLVLAGAFSRELDRELGRLRVCLPPLRERGDDIRLLARYFLGASGEEVDFTPGALDALREYPFPGNVRELRNLVRRLAIVPLASPSSSIAAADVRNQVMLASCQKAGGVKPTWRFCLEAARSEIVMRRLRTTPLCDAV